MQCFSAHRLINTLFDVVAGPAQEPLPVPQAFALWVAASVNKVMHLIADLSLLPRLVDPHVPFDQTAHLSVGIAVAPHPIDKL